MPNMKPQSRYRQIIEKIFLAHYTKGAVEIPFARDEIVRVAKQLRIDLPKNLGDVVYAFRYRQKLPKKIRDLAPKGKDWIIRPAGQSRYVFCAVDVDIVNILPNKVLSETKVPDATPGLIAMYALSDEQSLLAKLRYNRLLDVFTGVACYSLQSHLRTKVPRIGQTETDELYLGIGRGGAHYIFPVQAKGRKDRLNVV